MRKTCLKNKNKKDRIKFMLQKKRLQHTTQYYTVKNKNTTQRQSGFLLLKRRGKGKQRKKKEKV